MNQEIPDNLQRKLNPKTASTMIYVSIFEFEVFILSGQIVKVAGKDAWLSVLIGGFLVSLATYFLLRLATRFPKENLFQYQWKVWGTPLGYIFATGYILFWFLFLVILLKNANEANQILFLREIPAIITAFLIAIAAVILVVNGLVAIARFFQAMLPFIIVPLLIVLFFTLPNIKLPNFYPVMAGGFVPVLKGALIYAGVLQGLEVVLFLSPFFNDVKKTFMPSQIGINAINITVIFLIVTAIGSLGVPSIQKLVWPGVAMLEMIEIPGLPVMRFDLILTIPWLVGVFTTICLVLYLLSSGIAQVYNLRSKKIIIISLTAGIAILATYFIPNFAWSMELRQIISRLTIVFIYIIPLLTLIVAILRGVKGKS